MSVSDTGRLRRLAHTGLEIAAASNYTLQVLDGLGSLAFFLPIDTWRSIDPEELKTFMVLMS